MKYQCHWCGKDLEPWFERGSYTVSFICKHEFYSVNYWGTYKLKENCMTISLREISIANEIKNSQVWINDYYTFYNNPKNRLGTRVELNFNIFAYSIEEIFRKIDRILLLGNR